MPAIMSETIGKKSGPTVGQVSVATAERRPEPESPREAYRARRISNWDYVARNFEKWSGGNRHYHQRLAHVFGNLVPPGQRILELGCAQGDLLAALKPAYGVGIDFSTAMIDIARQKHPELTFVQADAHEITTESIGGAQAFDVIILSDLINDVWDVEMIFRRLQQFVTPYTRVIVNYYSRVWAPLLALTAKLGLATPRLPQNWLVPEDVDTLLYLAGFETLRKQHEILWPLPVRPLSVLFNRWLAKLWPFHYFALTNLTVARPIPGPPAQEVRVSVVVPARNEAGNIAEIIRRTPQMGAGTELIFVEGNSTDDTFETIQREVAKSGQPIKIFQQTGKGKGDAVRLGFAKATGQVLMILDADITVSPEDLPKFYEALVSGKGDFINGVRLVYPMHEEAMRTFNFLGNKFFSLAFSWLLRQPIKDTLCGTKVLWKKDYESIAANRAYFGDFDPFGDFDLLFGAARLNRKIVDLPVRYGARTYGETNIQRWKHGVVLLRMAAFAALRVKFT
jgi:ubiquinone/menaquinone biosynthesis C-methylase UbiE